MKRLAIATYGFRGGCQNNRIAIATFGYRCVTYIAGWREIIRFAAQIRQLVRFDVER